MESGPSEFSLQNTAKKQRYDTSVDTSSNDFARKTAEEGQEERDTAEIYGEGSQGPYGQPTAGPPFARQPTLAESETMETTSKGDLDETEEGPDWSVVLANGDEAEALNAASKAASSAHRACNQGSGGGGGSGGGSGGDEMSTVVDALEKAEAQFDASHQHGAAEPSGRRTLAGLMDHLERAAGKEEATRLPTGLVSAPALGAGSPAGASGSARPANGVDDRLRERGRQRVTSSLRNNPSLAGAGEEAILSHAAAIEEDCYRSCNQRQVYVAKIANSSRLAAKMTDPEELTRVASGMPKQVAEGTAAPSQLGDSVTGMTGTVLKPHYT